MITKQTPVFGITYPCSGTNIPPGVFCQFASDVEAALQATQDQIDLAANRPAASVSVSNTTQNVAVNTLTDIEFDTELFDNDTMADLGANNERLTVATGGVYRLEATFLGASLVTASSVAIEITQNGTRRYRVKEVPATLASAVLSVAGPVDCQPGDILRVAVRWTGSGGPLTGFDATLGATLMATN